MVEAGMKYKQGLKISCGPTCLMKPEQPQILPGRRPIIQIAGRPILQQPQNIIQV